MIIEFDSQGFANVINGVIASLTSAIFIFIFIWLVRKVPKLKISGSIYISPSHTNQLHDDSGRELTGVGSIDMIFSVVIGLSLHNDSKNTIRSLSGIVVKYALGNDFRVVTPSVTIPAEGSASIHFIKEIKKHVTNDTYDEIFNSVKKKYLLPFEI